MNTKIAELVERIRLTPEERLQAENGALAHLHSQGKVIGVDSFERRDLAYTVRLFVAEAQLKKVLNDPDLALIDRENTLFEDQYSIILIAEALKEVEE